MESYYMIYCNHFFVNYETWQKRIAILIQYHPPNTIESIELIMKFYSQAFELCPYYELYLDYLTFCQDAYEDNLIVSTIYQIISCESFLCYRLNCNMKMNLRSYYQLVEWIFILLD